MPNGEVFELVDVALLSDDLGRVSVPLAGGGEAGPFELHEGAVMTVALTFRLHQAVDGLTFTDTRRREGFTISSSPVALGSFRPGGPYEVHLPAERLPVGRAVCGVYEVTGVFTDGAGRELSREVHRFRIVHQPRLVHGGHPRDARAEA
ncbi:hypothetical protein [Streptomyces sp. NPDC051211]|uniref:hypothetical protein n=1 Tax=Streptomyces sp. NPDC051211 TaxID=3154643 RepID=UPI00345057D6